MKLYLTRHAQAEHNVKSILNNDPSVDNNLTDLGIEQAKKLSKSLKGINLDAIYISELPRTRQTAEYLEQYSEVPVIVDKRINENVSGYEGQSRDEYVKVFNASLDKWNTKFNDGESLAEVRLRVENFLNYLKAKDYESVLVVTHGYIIECIYGILNNADFDLASTFKIPQGSYELFSLE
jgi:broad specificity phosphatase PhoE